MAQQTTGSLDSQTVHTASFMINFTCQTIKQSHFDFKVHLRQHFYSFKWLKKHFLLINEGVNISIYLHFHFKVTFILNADLDGAVINYSRYLLRALNRGPCVSKNNEAENLYILVIRKTFVDKRFCFWNYLCNQRGD